MLILALVFILLVFKVYPFTKWAVMTLDKHYYGYFSERVPRLATTTQMKNYYEEKNIPYRTIEEVDAEKNMYNIRKKNGIPHPWEANFVKPQPVETVKSGLMNLGRRMLRAL